MNKSQISLAKKLHSQGNAEELYEHIKLDINREDPYAMYFYSTISLVEWDETAEEFDKRRLRCLKKAVDGEVADAAYQLASIYLYGEGVIQDREQGKYYAKLANKFGHPHAKALLDQLQQQ